MLHTHAHTYRQTNYIMAPCTQPGMKRLFALKETTSVASIPRRCLITSRDVNEARWPHTCCRPCAFEEKKSKKTKTIKIHPAQTHRHIHSSPATATNSRRRAMRHVPRISPYSPASIGPGFAEIGLVQLSQSVRTTNVTHTLADTDRRTDRQD